MSTVNKYFPADISLDYATFLNDPKANGKLYGFLSTYAVKENGEMVIHKKDLPTQAAIGKKLKVARSTIINHLNYLEKQGFLINDSVNGRYVLPLKEGMYFRVPSDTTRFLLGVAQDNVIKTYVYLGQRYIRAPENQNFTIEEICDYLKIKPNNSNEAIVNNYLITLSAFGLIDYITTESDLELLKVSTKCPANRRGDEK